MDTMRLKPDTLYYNTHDEIIGPLELDIVRGVWRDVNGDQYFQNGEAVKGRNLRCEIPDTSEWKYDRPTWQDFLKANRESEGCAYISLPGGRHGYIEKWQYEALRDYFAIKPL